MSRIKGTTAVALTLGMLFTSIPYAALADTTTVTDTAITQTKAIELAKQYVTIPEGYIMRNATYDDGKQNPYQATGTWIINFSKERGGGSINVVINAKTGALINLDIWQQEDTLLEDAISRDQAKLKVMDYLKQFAPDKLNQLQEIESPDKFYKYGPYGSRDLMQSFRFARVVNGVIYPVDGITIRVNGKGELRGYSYNWSDNIQFPSAKPAITEDQAKEAFKNSLDLQLFYQRVYKPYATKNLDNQLVYGTWRNPYENGGFPIIDAAKGVSIGRDGNPVSPPPALEFKTLTDKPGQPKTTKEITKEVAEELINSYNLGLDGYNLAGTNYSNFNDDDFIWRFNYTKGDSADYKTMKSIMVSIDAKTGELRELYRNEYREGPYEFPQNPAITEDQARQKAIEFIKNVMPTRTDKLAFVSTSDSVMGKSGPGYSFVLVRMENGVPVRDISTRVMIDPVTGNVTEFYGANGWNEKFTFQDKTNAVSKETAKNKFLDKYKLQLQYVPIFATGSKPYEPGKIIGTALVYAPFLQGPMQNLNAVSGEWVSDWGEMPPQPVEIQDIKGHWAEKQLRYFVERGVFQVKEGQVNPNETVTRGDMLKYLIMSISGPRIMQDKSTFNDVAKTDPNFDFIEEAVARKWIDKDTKNFRPNDAITREELADIVTAILGYAKLSEAPDTFINHFRDVEAGSDKFAGDIAIVGALGIMTGNDGLFQPQQKVSKAQAAVVMTRVLDQMKEKQMYPY